MHYLGHRFWAFVLFELGPHDSGFNNTLSRFVLRVLFGHAIICLAGSVPVSKSRYFLSTKWGDTAICTKYSIFGCYVVDRVEI